MAGDLAASGTSRRPSRRCWPPASTGWRRRAGVLERAAIVGQAFEWRRGRRAVAAERPGARCRTAPARAGAAGADPSGPPGQLRRRGRFQFRHLLIRDAAYEGVPKEVRAELHERSPGWLEPGPGSRVREYEEIARLPPGAGLPLPGRARPGRRARPRARRPGGRPPGHAGRRALARGDTPAAAALLDRAVSLLPADHPLLALLLTDLAESLIHHRRLPPRATRRSTEALAAAGPDDAGLRAHGAITRLRMRLTTDPELEFEPLRQQAEAAIAGWSDSATSAAWPEPGCCSATSASSAAASSRPSRRSPRHRARRQAGDERLEAYGRGMLTGPPSGSAARRRRRSSAAAASRPTPMEPLRRGQRPLCPRRLVAMQGRFDEAREQVAQGKAIAGDLGLRRPERR